MEKKRLDMVLLQQQQGNQSDKRKDKVQKVQT